MTTTNNNFRVRNGIEVNGNAVVSGTITAADPVSDSHIATKGYVDSVAIPAVADTAPSTPESGQLWLDTISNRLHIFDGTSWLVMALIEDANYLQDHIHDTSIDGDGRIVSIFVEGGTPETSYFFTYEAGSPSTTDWADTWSGGIAVDNFN